MYKKPLYPPSKIRTGEATPPPQNICVKDRNQFLLLHLRSLLPVAEYLPTTLVSKMKTFPFTTSAALLLWSLVPAPVHALNIDRLVARASYDYLFLDGQPAVDDNIQRNFKKGLCDCQGAIGGNAVPDENKMFLCKCDFCCPSSISPKCWNHASFPDKMKSRK